MSLNMSDGLESKPRTGVRNMFRDFMGRISGRASPVPVLPATDPDHTSATPDISSEDFIKPQTSLGMRPVSIDHLTPDELPVHSEINLDQGAPQDIAFLAETGHQAEPQYGPAVVETIEETLRSPLHALIVGIDRYSSRAIDDLSGAVSDSESMYNYLRTELQVPERQIVILRNEAATRHAIIRNIQAFAMWATIRDGDPILIYFAGHGSTTDAPEEWHVGRQTVSLIVPHDATGCLLDTADNLVKHAIPDRTIGALLHDLAEGKNRVSNNITVVFDCCHSGSGTRGASVLRPRGVNLKSHRIPANLDQQIWASAPQGRDLKAAAGFANAGTRSHVLLAACRETEIAYEGDSRGLFTQALVGTLKKVPTDKTSYSDLIRCIPDIPNQAPQCEGYYTDRPLFNALVPCKQTALYDAKVEGDGSVTVAAGSIHGVEDDSEFAFYKSAEPQAGVKPLAIMKPETAEKVKGFATQLPPHTLLPSEGQPYFASVSSTGEAEALRLYFSPSDAGVDVIKDAVEKAIQHRRVHGGGTIILEDVEEDAHLSVRTSDGCAMYTTNEPLITELVPSLKFGTTKVDSREIQLVLIAAVHFFWHLFRSPKTSELVEHVDVKFFKLKEDVHGELGPDRNRPWAVSDSDGDLFESGVVEVVADDDTPYGMAIKNHSASALHVWAFYFDCSTLSVSEYYKPSITGRDGAEPSLQENGELTIGYGAGGAVPYTFTLGENQDTDLGFIKLFISTEPVDLSRIEHISPFGRRARNIKRKSRPPAPVWDTLTIPVIQRKPEVPKAPSTTVDST
ncbi:unnamed protein product [Peniophora sp. CBMAI 1063]|nr:unnamed protein product [Peniophora sp. CBMAI 1063]